MRLKMSKSETLTIRLDPELRRRVEDAQAASPYKFTITTIVERGLLLALAELEMMSEAGGTHRLKVIQARAAGEGRAA
jgi:hypothetical protein